MESRDRGVDNFRFPGHLAASPEHIKTSDTAAASRLDLCYLRSPDKTEVISDHRHIDRRRPTMGMLSTPR